MRSATLLAFIVLVAACVKAPPVPTDSPISSNPETSGDAPARFDILFADLRELNGSIVVRIQIRNYADGLPLTEARLTTDSGTFFTRLVEDPARPSTPKVRAETGIYVADRHEDSVPACWFPSFPLNPQSSGPWWIFLEVPHNRTSLADGGVIHRLAVMTRDENATLRDEAVTLQSFPVRGGANPYTDRDPPCPLHHERADVQ